MAQRYLVAFGSDLTKLFPCMKLRQMSLRFLGLEQCF